MYKKCDARAKLLFCLLNLLFFHVLVAVASLDLKDPTMNSRARWNPREDKTQVFTCVIIDIPVVGA